ncbi:MAG: glyoxylate/hydroxypyruvate reductase A [Proteobacteria bacterium]|nr:glyoxylate/hydroxypyruvate reductase A [Pseudomonadota bacterium]
MNILFLSKIEPAERWIPGLSQLLPHDRFFTPDSYDPAEIDIALVARPQEGIVAGLPNLKLIQSLWMGVDGLLADATFPRARPLARLVDPGMVAAMTESVVAHVLDYHRHHYVYRAQKLEKKWHRLPQYMAADRTIGILGLGELGTAVAQRLLPFGFGVAGWKRRPAQVPGIDCYSGSAGMQEMLARSQAVVCLLPLTPETRGLLNAAAFALMPEGSCVINVARGAQLVVQDLIAALDAGHLAHAYLDVFDPEPLPADSPLWAHPGVSITPHTAALTEPRTAMARIVENIERVRAGQPALNLVDFGAGY